MTTAIWSLVIFLHVVAAAFWVGGQLMLAVVVMPALRRSAPPEQVQQVASVAGQRFARLTNAGLLPLLAVTGLLLAWHDGVRPHNLTTTAFGRVLVIKGVLTAFVFALAGAHGAMARRFTRRGVRGLAIFTVVISLVILGLAAALAVLPGP